MGFKYKIEIKHRLEEYLKMNGVKTKGLFRCLSLDHNDNKPSMSFKNDMVMCFSCKVRFDIFNLIGQDFGLETFKDQYEKACYIFGYADEFNRNKYKKSAEKIKNEVVNVKILEEKKFNKYNKFYDNLSEKMKKFNEDLSIIEDCGGKDSKIYIDIKFKLDFIDRFLKTILEYEGTSTLRKINDFNDLYEIEYSNFRKNFLDKL
jgi:hypothetical protein